MALDIKERYGVSDTVSGLHKGLHRNGLSDKKPKGRPHKADPALQKQWMIEQEKLKAAVAPDEPMLFMDAVHPTQATKLSYGWISTGKTKYVETTASRTRLNSVGAIQRGHISEPIASQQATINAASLVDFMTKVRSQYASKTVHIFLDQSGYHRAA